MPQAPLATSDLLPGEWRGNAVCKSLENLSASLTEVIDVLPITGASVVQRVVDVGDRLGECQLSELGNESVCDGSKRHIVFVCHCSVSSVPRQPQRKCCPHAHDELNVRAGPSTKEAILVVLTRGTPIFAQRARGPWLQVRTLKGQVGWVYESLVGKS